MSLWKRSNSKAKLNNRKSPSSYGQALNMSVKVFTVYADTLDEIEQKVNQTTKGRHVRDISIKFGYSPKHKFTVFISHLCTLDNNPIPENHSYRLNLRILTSHDEIQLINDANIFMGSVLGDACEFVNMTGNKSLDVVKTHTSLQTYVALITYRIPF